MRLGSEVEARHDGTPIEELSIGDADGLRSWGARDAIPVIILTDTGFGALLTGELPVAAVVLTAGSEMR